MDIPEVSMALASANIQNSFSVAMLSKTLDTGEQMASGVIDMINKSAMELSVNPNVGGNIDVYC